MSNSQLLIYPMGLYAFYVAGLFVYTFLRRAKATQAGEFSGLYYKDYSQKQDVPREFILLERHMDHQFQAPTVFLATGAVCLAMNSVTLFTVGLAWAFVFFRLLHSYIHLGRNKILWRAGAYALGGTMILLMWAELMLNSFGG